MPDRNAVQPLRPHTGNAGAVERGAGNGVAIPDNSGITVDADFRSYAIQATGCPGAAGQATVLDSTLAPIGTIALGECPRASLVTLLPALSG